MLLVFQADNVTRRALLSYHVASGDRFYPETVNQLNLTSSNVGDKSCSFYMLIRSVNASFPAPTQSTYVHINNTLVKVLFTLSERWFSMNKATESIFFYIDENVPGFSFKISPESWNNGVFVSSENFVRYIWNEREKCYMLRESGMWVT